MIDEKFSLDAFSKQLDDNNESQGLSKLLEREIQGELQILLEEKLKEIVKQLNSLGHNLTLYYTPELGDISYRDISQEKCLLRISVDCIVSVGFSDTIDLD